jgi:hypothetical protein
MHYWYRSPLILLLVSLAGLAALTLLSPAEATLGPSVRIVYLHGAWVWAALLAWIAAGVVGLLGLLRRKLGWQLWSRSLARTGLFFWISYLPLSLWAMQANWNGLFLAEPRWRMAMIFAVTGLLLQIGLTLINRPVWDAGANLSFVLILFAVLQATENVMHPPGPMLESEFGRIQIFFIGLTLLTLFAAWQIARWFHRWVGSPSPG